MEPDYNESYGFEQRDHYCKHGTYIGGWAGPDYLCGHCEMGEDVHATWLGVRVTTLFFNANGEILLDATNTLTPRVFFTQKEGQDYLTERIKVWEDTDGAEVEHEPGTNFGRVTMRSEDGSKSASITMTVELFETGGWMTSRDALEMIEEGIDIMIQRGQSLVDNLRSERRADADKLEAHLHQCVEDGFV